MIAKNTTLSTRKHGNIPKKFANKQLKHITQEQAEEESARFLVSARLMSTIGLKKTVQTHSDFHILELDELYWFIGQKSKTKTRENTYVMTMVSRLPRQIVGFDVAFDKSPKRIQRIVDKGPEAEYYCTDGYRGYVDIVYPGKHIRNICDKSNTFTVEGINADLRHYIPLLRRRSRCFPRKLDTLKAVLELFVQAYNAFGVAKMNYRKNRTSNSRELPFSVLDFL